MHPNMKAEGIWCIVYENVNSIKPILSNNSKLIKFCDMIDNLQAIIVSVCKHEINILHSTVVNSQQQLFQWEATIQAVEGHNTHKTVGWVQEGGTLMIAVDEITQFYTKQESDADLSCLGRWVPVVLRAKQMYYACSHSI